MHGGTWEQQLAGLCLGVPEAQQLEADCLIGLILWGTNDETDWSFNRGTF